MPRPQRIYSGNTPDLQRRARMSEMIIAQTPIEIIAKELGYANTHSAKVMAHRFGLNHLLPGSRGIRNAACRCVD